MNLKNGNMNPAQMNKILFVMIEKGGPGMKLREKTTGREKQPLP